MVKAKETRSHYKSKNILMCFIRDIIFRGDVEIERVSSTNNIIDSLTKLFSQEVF